MIEKIILASRTTEVDAVSIRLTGAYKNTGLNSDANLATVFTGLEPLSAELTLAINCMKAQSEQEENDGGATTGCVPFATCLWGLATTPTRPLKPLPKNYSKYLKTMGWL